MLPFLRDRYLRRIKWQLTGESVEGLPSHAWEEGRAWPRPFPHEVLTMIGRRRLDNLEYCVREALRRGVAGDFIEAGVWRGGAGILVRAVLAAHGVSDRVVYLADSFAGVPPPQPDLYPLDEVFTLHLDHELVVSADQVKTNFARFNLLDDQVRFVEGWFRDTLPPLRDHRWAVVRLDGDLYESTVNGLENLYPGLSPGGFVIVDDYHSYSACAAAVDEYRELHGINDPLLTIDSDGVYWQRTGLTE